MKQSAAASVTLALLLSSCASQQPPPAALPLKLGFGANRFTAPAAEGYFGYVLRVGVRLLFFYLALAIGVQMANQWASALLAACKPVTTTLPWWTTYGLPPSAIFTTVCSGSLPCVSNAQLRSGCHRLYGREYRRSLHRSRNRWGHNRPCS